MKCSPIVFVAIAFRSHFPLHNNYIYCNIANMCVRAQNLQLFIFSLFLFRNKIQWVVVVINYEFVPRLHTSYAGYRLPDTQT